MALSEQKIKGRLGLNHIERMALEAGCKMIPVPEDLDTGIDGYIEYESPDNKDGRLLAFQVKYGESFFEEGRPRVQVNDRLLRYWRDYAVPVLLIVVSPKGDIGYWMDVQGYAREQPQVVSGGPYSVWLPLDQRFSSSALVSVLMPLYSRQPDFADGVRRLCSGNPIRRISALSVLFPFHKERLVPFCLAAAIKQEDNPEVMLAMCDFYSRYLHHPEAPFFVDQQLQNYAFSQLARMPYKSLLAILLGMINGSEDYSLEAATEIYSLSEEEVWDRCDVIDRGTQHQGLAEVVSASASGDDLWRVVLDGQAPDEARQAAVALYGYLGYSRSLEEISQALSGGVDSVTRALLIWLRFWIAQEEAEEMEDPAGV